MMPEPASHGFLASLEDSYGDGDPPPDA